MMITKNILLLFIILCFTGCSNDKGLVYAIAKHPVSPSVGNPINVSSIVENYILYGMNKEKIVTILNEENLEKYSIVEIKKSWGKEFTKCDDILYAGYDFKASNIFLWKYYDFEIANFFTPYMYFTVTIGFNQDKVSVIRAFYYVNY